MEKEKLSEGRNRASFVNSPCALNGGLSKTVVVVLSLYVVAPKTTTAAVCALPAWAPLRQLAAKKAVLFSPAPFMPTANTAVLALAARPLTRRGCRSPRFRPSLARATAVRLSARASQVLSHPCLSLPSVPSPLLRLHFGGVTFGLPLGSNRLRGSLGSTPAFVRPTRFPPAAALFSASAPSRGALVKHPVRGCLPRAGAFLAPLL